MHYDLQSSYLSCIGLAAWRRDPENKPVCPSTRSRLLDVTTKRMVPPRPSRTRQVEERDHLVPPRFPASCDYDPGARQRVAEADIPGWMAMWEARNERERSWTGGLGRQNRAPRP